jgi:integrase
MNGTQKSYTYEEMLKHPSLKRVEGRYERTKWPGVFRYIGRNGVKFGIDYYASGKQRREMIGSLQEAREKLREVHNQIQRGDFVVNRKKFTFDQLKTKYEEIYKGEPYFENSRKYYLKILQGFFSSMKLYQISPFDIEQFKKKRKETPTQHGKERSGVSVNREMETLRHMFNKAMEWGMMEKNPFDRFKDSILFPEDSGRVRYLTEDEIKALLSAAPPYLRNILKGALLTGLRKGDLLSLKWEDVDLEKGILFFNEQKKNGKRRAKILNQDFLDLLMSIRKGKSEYVFNAPVPRKKGEKEYVAYPDPDGRPLKDCQRSFRSALKKGGIKDFHFHDLRHTSASYMVMKGASMKAVQEHLGHSNLAMTERYSHLSPDYLKAEVERLNGVFTERPCDEILMRSNGKLEAKQQVMTEVSA